MAREFLRIFASTNQQTGNWDTGRTLLNALEEMTPSLRPEFIGWFENELTVPYDGVEASRATWEGRATVRSDGHPPGEWHLDFCWKRKARIRSAGTLTHTRETLHTRRSYGRGYVSIEAELDLRPDWLGLFRTICGLLNPVHGALHAFTKAEVAVPMKTQIENAFRSCRHWKASWSEPEAEAIIDLHWATFLGGPFAAAVDAERIAAAGFPIEKIGDGYLLRVSERLEEVRADFAGFRARRAALKALFPVGFFLIGEGSDAAGQEPAGTR